MGSVVNGLRWGIAALAMLWCLNAAAQADLGPQIAQLGPGGAPGVLTTTVYGELPAAVSVNVEPYDDSELNLQIKAAFDEELVRRNQASAPAGDFQFGFDTQILQGEFDGAGPSLGSFRARSLTGVDFQLNIWSSTKDSVLGGRQKGADSKKKMSVFHINAELRDGATGEVLWSGDAFCEMLGGDTLRIARSMVRPLIANLGRTARDVPFDIQ